MVKFAKILSPFAFIALLIIMVYVSNLIFSKYEELEYMLTNTRPIAMLSIALFVLIMFFSFSFTILFAYSFEKEEEMDEKKRNLDNTYIKYVREIKKIAEVKEKYLDRLERLNMIKPTKPDNEKTAE